MNSSTLFIIRRRWAILVLLPLIVVAAVLFLTPKPKAQATRYTATLYLGANPQETGTVAVEQAALEIKQDEVAKAAAASLGESTDDPRAFAKRLKLKVKTDSLTIEMSTSSADKEAVEPYLTAFANAYIAYSTKEATDKLQARVDELQKARDLAQADLTTFINDNRFVLEGENPDAAAVAQRDVLSSRLTDAETLWREAKDTQIEGIYEIKGTTPVTVVAPEKLQLPASSGVRAVLAFILGALGAIALVAFLEKLNPRVDSPAEAEEIVGAAVLAQVPVVRGKRKAQIERASLADFSGPFAESFRATRSHLDFLGTVEKLDRPPCVMVVSSAPGEGKTTSSSFLALSYAEVGREVVVVGADFRRPAVHRLFDVPRSPGLSSRLFDEGASEADVVSSIVKRDPSTGVRVIPSGPGTDRVTGLLGDLAIVTKAGLQSGCTVVLDTAPVMVANDALDYLPLVDWVVVVVRLGSTTQRSLRQTIQSLHLNEANIAGCIVVGSLEAADAKRYYYSYYSVDESAEANGASANGRSDRGFPSPAPAGGADGSDAAPVAAADDAGAADADEADDAPAEPVQPPSTVR